METTKAPPPAQCCQCEGPIDLDVGDSPLTREGEAYCDDCFTALFEFTCAWCGEYGDVADQHRYLLVFDAEETGLVLDGVYLIQETPYYTSARVGQGWLHDAALKWLGALPAGLIPDAWYPCGHLCAGCQKRMRKDLAERQGILHDVQ